MKRASLTILSAIALAGCLVGYTTRPAAAEPPQLNQLLVAVNDEQIISILEGMQIEHETFKDEEGLTAFRMQMGETVVNLYQYQTDGRIKSWRLSAGYDVNRDPGADKVNSFNRKYRFAYSYLDTERDPFLVSDLDISAGVTQQSVRNYISIFGEALDLFESEVLGMSPGEGGVQAKELR